MQISKLCLFTVINTKQLLMVIRFFKFLLYNRKIGQKEKLMNPYSIKFDELNVDKFIQIHLILFFH